MNQYTMIEQQEFGQSIGTSRGHLRNIVNGSATCSAALAVKIERAAKRLGWAIPVEDLCPEVDWAYIRRSDKPTECTKKVIARK